MASLLTKWDLHTVHTHDRFTWVGSWTWKGKGNKLTYRLNRTFFFSSSPMWLQSSFMVVNEQNRDRPIRWAPAELLKLKARTGRVWRNRTLIESWISWYHSATNQTKYTYGRMVKWLHNIHGDGICVRALFRRRITIHLYNYKWMVRRKRAKCTLYL